MQRGLRYLLAGDDAKALPWLRKEWERDSEDVMLVGGATDYGVALLGLGRFRRAEQHFRKLQKSALCSVSEHFIYGGLGAWFAGRSDDAVAMWKKGLKAQYSSFQGFDVPFVLWYAALRRPEALSLDEVRPIFVQKLKRLSVQTYASHVARFLLEEESAARLKAALLDTRNVKYKEAFTVEHTLLLTYYQGLADLRDSSVDAYLDRMRTCADVRCKFNRRVEQVIARCEIRQQAKKPASSQRASG